MKVGQHVIALAAIAVLTLVLMLKVRRDPRCGVDEPGWLRSGAVTYQLVSHRASAAQWETAYAEHGEFDNRNPPIGKLIVGAILAANGIHRANYWWHWPLSYEENLARGILPPIDVLRSARYGIAVLGAVALVLAYCIAWRLTRSAWAIAAPVYVFSLPVFQFLATHVYTDIIEVTLMLASGLALLVYVDHPRRPAALAVAAVAVGLACATKFSAGPLAIALVIIVVRVTRFRLWPVTIAVAVPLLVFVLVNPYLYRAPVTRTHGLITAWGDLIHRQQEQSPGLAVTARATALELVLTRTVFPELYAIPLLVRLTLSAVLLIGVYQLSSSPWLIIVLVQTAATVLWLPFDWQPYYFPTLAVLAPAIAPGCHRVAHSRLLST